MGLWDSSLLSKEIQHNKGSISFQQELVQWENMNGLSSSQLSDQYLW